MRWCFEAVAWLLWRRLESCDGVDVSKYRGIVDWPAVKASGSVRFAYAEASHGTDPDGQYDDNCSGCTAAQIPFGAFHFLLFTEDVGTQAGTFLNQISKGFGMLRPAVDVESRSDTDKRRAGTPEMTPSKRATALKAFCELVEPTTGPLMIYTNVDYWNVEMAGTDAFSNRSLWIAYPRKCIVPPLPNGWRRWALWQHSFSGSVPGINAGAPPVDLDRTNGTMSSIIRSNPER